MNDRPHDRAAKALAVLAGCLILMATPAFAGSLHSYRVTLENLSSGQPLSPPLAATHRPSVMMFQVGKLVSGEAEILAEDGDEGPLYWLFRALTRVSDVVDVGVPLVPAGSAAGGLSDRVTFDIRARGGDRLSLASMLVCTNDGVTGVDRLKLRGGARTHRLLAYDAGTEDNTELSTDLPDACSVLGPLPLAGDPNGNQNAAVDSVPHLPLARHPGLQLGGDLGPAHRWSDPVARLTVVRLARPDSKHFAAELSGFAVSPPAATDAAGSARFELQRRNTLKYKLALRGVDGVNGAHLHLGPPGIAGPMVATLYAPEQPERRRDLVHRGEHDDGDGDELEVEGRLDASDLLGGPFAGDFDAFIDALGSGQLYLNVPSPTYPGGELRGQVGARD